MKPTSTLPMRVLVVASYVPYPPNHGAAVDIWARLRTLRELGCEVDLIATGLSEPDADCVKKLEERVSSFRFVRRHGRLRSALKLTPYQICSRRRLREVRLSGPYAVVILESEYVASILDNPTLSYRHLVLRAHNDEQRYFSELAKTGRSVRARVFYALEAGKFARSSPGLLRACEQLWFISDHERAEYVRKHPAEGDKAVFLPPRVEMARLPARPLEEKAALFVGGLSIPMNVAGIRWYLSSIHEQVQRQCPHKLLIAGYTQGSDTAWLHDLRRRLSGVEVYEDVDDLSELYGRATVFVNPILSGAGMKVKTVQAIAAGLPVVTTTIGAEGTGLLNRQHLYIEDEAAGFSKAVADLLTHEQERRRLVDAAQEFIGSVYDQAAIMRRCLAALELKDGADGDGGRRR